MGFKVRAGYVRCAAPQVLPCSQAVYTDHSLFGFADAARVLLFPCTTCDLPCPLTAACCPLIAALSFLQSININKLMKFTMSDIDHAICVSHTWYDPLALPL